jgi:hypothetical protein
MIKKIINVNVSPEAHIAWQRYCKNRHITVSALVQAIANIGFFDKEFDDQITVKELKKLLSNEATRLDLARRKREHVHR